MSLFITKCIISFQEVLGGTDEKCNLIILSAREHYIAHWMLWKAYRCRSMTSAFMMMHTCSNGQYRHINSKIYESLKKDYSKIQSVRLIGENNPFYGKKHTENSKLKMSLSKAGVNNSWNTGMTKETNEKLKQIGKNISSAVEGMRHWTNGIVSVKCKECPGDGWYIGRAPSENYVFSEERKRLMREYYSNGRMTWWNNGVINKRQKHKPEGNNWVSGRLKSSMSGKFCGKKKYKSITVQNADTGEIFDILWNEETFKARGDSFRVNIISRRKHKNLILIKVEYNK